MGRRVATDEELIQIRKAQVGDARALDWIVRTHWLRVQRLLTRIWGPRQDLEDLVQTTFLETLRALPSFRRESELSTFVSGIAIRVARRALRPSLVVRHAVAMDESMEPSTEGGLEQQLRDVEALRRAQTILSSVTEPKRVAFLLWALEGMAIPDIAASMEASIAATRSRIFYAQKELAKAAQADPYLLEWLTEVGRV
ncbi:MAG: polymerase sigma factor [Myxococcaceae bacterium]|nr:polymerase sigma factor [Myxococcaceae bacterium]